jgi:hypothetical protein
MRTIAAVAVFLVLGAFAPSALAAPPENVNDVFVREDLCAFPVSIASTGKVKTIALPGGRVLYTAPGFFVTVTNLAEPSHQVTLNATGAFHDTVLESGEVVTASTGRSILINIVPGSPLVLAIGNFSFGFDAQGNPTRPFRGTGQVIDICTLLR